MIKNGTKITKAIQVTANLSNPKTKEREIRGLLEAMNKFELNDGFIITLSEEKKLTINKKTIHIVPLWKFLLKD